MVHITNLVPTGVKIKLMVAEGVERLTINKQGNVGFVSLLLVWWRMGMHKYLLVFRYKILSSKIASFTHLSHTTFTHHICKSTQTNKHDHT